MTDRGTTQIEHDGKTIYFTDLVYENQRVQVFDSYEKAEDERGRWSAFLVQKTDDKWRLEPCG